MPSLTRRRLPLWAVAGLAALVAALALALVDGSRAPAFPDPPERVGAYLEAEEFLPAIEGFPGIPAGTETVAVARPQGNPPAGPNGLRPYSWSSNRSVLFENATAGNRFSLALPVPAGRRYAVRAQFGQGPDHGIARVRIDGRPLGGPVDGYAPERGRPAPVELGVIALAEGRHLLTVTVDDKAAESSSYRAVLDYVELESVD